MQQHERHEGPRSTLAWDKPWHESCLAEEAPFPSKGRRGEFQEKDTRRKGKGPETRERVERRTHARERVIYVIDEWGRTKPKNESVFNAASEARKMEVARDSMLSTRIASQQQLQQVHLGIGTEFLP